MYGYIHIRSTYMYNIMNIYTYIYMYIYAVYMCVYTHMLYIDIQHVYIYIYIYINRYISIDKYNHTQHIFQNVSKHKQ